MPAAKKAPTVKVVKETKSKQRPAPEPPVPLEDIEDQDLREDLRPYLLKRGFMKEQEKVIEATIKDDKKTGEMGLNTILLQLVKLTGKRSIICKLPSGNQLRTSVTTGVNRRLDKDKLLKAGVRADVIQACYTEKEYEAIQVSLIVGGKEEEEDE
jgi:hypothetical protein